MNYLEKHNILTSLNHGFRSGHSCETQLAVTIHDMLQSFDRKKQLDIAILDFFKAFDTVPHDKTPTKAEQLRHQRPSTHMANYILNKAENACNPRRGILK